MLKYHIQTIEVPSGGSSAITFNNIPQIYDDLIIVASLRDNVSGEARAFAITANSVTPTARGLIGNGSSAFSHTETTYYALLSGGSATANTFGNLQLTFSNYKSGSSKLASLDYVTETNSTAGFQGIHALLFNTAQPVSTVSLIPLASSLVQHSSASLYGIKRGSDSPPKLASGGVVTESGGYTIHTFSSSGSFVTNSDLNVECLVVAGGGGGDKHGGGGAGGYRTTSQFLSRSTTYAVTVGAGGAGHNNNNDSSTNGSNSSFNLFTASGGGRGSTASSGGSGGSGGGAGGNAFDRTGGTGNSGSYSPVEGFAGGNGKVATNIDGGGGGGGASGVGQASSQPVSGFAQGGNGGSGAMSMISGVAVIRAGGGGGSGQYAAGGLAGTGGGGVGVARDTSRAATAGTVNTGGGGGGSPFDGTGRAGGSGIVIIRYLTPA